jgi:gamma-glutamyltranspeptidase
MTRTEQRLAELTAVRERELTDAEQAEVKRLAHLERQCAARRARYSADPSFRRKLIVRAVSHRREKHLRQQVGA